MFNFIKNLFKKPLRDSYQPTLQLNPGDKMREKEWPDNTIEIIQKSLSDKECRYKFLTINGKYIPFSSSYTMSCKFASENYEKIP